MEIEESKQPTYRETGVQIEEIEEEEYEEDGDWELSYEENISLEPQVQ